MSLTTHHDRLIFGEQDRRLMAGITDHHSMGFVLIYKDGLDTRQLPGSHRMRDVQGWSYRVLDQDAMRVGWGDDLYTPYPALVTSSKAECVSALESLIGFMLAADEGGEGSENSAMFDRRTLDWIRYWSEELAVLQEELAILKGTL